MIYGDGYTYSHLGSKYNCEYEFQRYAFTHLRKPSPRWGSHSWRVERHLREMQRGPGILEVGDLAPNIVRPPVCDNPTFDDATADQLVREDVV